ncbi:MAG TPA: DUF4035 domain-containing protein [Methylococcus sp.]|nr:DUF4035 domain-containing protein [Methylococcus sp.]
MSAEEHGDWEAYARIEPFGEERADLRSAMIAALLANIHRDGDRHPEPFQIADFLPRFGSHEPDDADPEKIEEAMMRFFHSRKPID